MMQRTFRAAALAGLAALTMATPAVAQHHSLKTTYFGVRHEVKQQQGKRAPGRNIVSHGVRTKHGVRPATNREVARSIRTFRRWLSPPWPGAAAGDRAPTAFRSSAANTGGRWAIPAAIVMCESHGDYRAENTANPDHPSGAYQITDDTWKAYGGSTATAAEASPGEQDEVAAKIYAAQGGAPWECKA